jgi:hypothetical protein
MKLNVIIEVDIDEDEPEAACEALGALEVQLWPDSDDEPTYIDWKTVAITQATAPFQLLYKLDS